MSRATIEIELAEGMASDDQNRILIIPWTPPSPRRRREIIHGEGDTPSATRPMRTEARAVLTDALRDAHHWLDELTTVPNLSIESLAAREGKTGRWIRRTGMADGLLSAGLASRSDVDVAIFEPEKSAQRAKPTVETGSPHAAHGNVALFPTLASHVGLRGLPGGAEGIQTAMLLAMRSHHLDHGR